MPGLQVSTRGNGEITLDEATIRKFKESLHGELILSPDPGYDDTRAIWNAMIDRRPALIARCLGVADVVTCVNFAREHGLIHSIKGGGHNIAGLAVCDGGLMLDMSRMRGVWVDPTALTARAQAGCLLSDVDRETQLHGLATVLGFISNTGIAGLTLGGGFGYLTRRFGWTSDNLLSMEVVTADGRIVRASEQENNDLFWGLRGGGGNFGVVTSIEYRLHPMNPVVLGGFIAWPWPQARDATRFYRDIALDAPEEVNLIPGWYWDGPGTPYFGVGVCWSGDHAAGEAWLKPLRAFGKPAMDTIKPTPYVRVQSASDASAPDGIHCYAKNGFVGALSDDGIDLLLDVFRRTPGLYDMFMDHCGGAYARVPLEATAFPRRDMAFILAIWSGWRSPDGLDEKVARMRATWKELEPLTRGFYTNYAGTDPVAARDRENFGANFERLVAVKTKYDPTNLFRLNSNIPPKT